MTDLAIETQFGVDSAEPATEIVDLPEEILHAILRFLDPVTLVLNASCVCQAWRHAALDILQSRLSPRLQGRLEQLAAMGPSVSPANLFLALSGRNFLRNPGFRRDDNSVILPPLGPLGSGRWTGWSRWQRTAWVLNTSVGKEVGWERVPLGMNPGGMAHDPTAPTPPLPYPGGSVLVSYMRGALKGLMELLQRGATSEGVMAAVRDSGAVKQPAAQALPAPLLSFWPQQQPQQPPSPPSPEVSGREGVGPDSAPGCLATLGTWSEVVQVVDLDWELQRRGLTAAQAAHLLDSELGLRLSVHVGSRSDSEAEYAVALLLDEGPGGVGPDATAAAADAIPSLQSFVSRPSRHLGYRECEHLPPGTWQRFEYRLPACPRGVRRAIVMLRGRRAPTASSGSGSNSGGSGSQPASRFCGAKFASAQLVFE